MEETKLKIRLAVSEAMSNSPKEDGYIRFSKAAREENSVRQILMTISTKDGKSLKLEVRQAYKEDLNYLVKQLQSGKITDEQAKITGFVSRATAATISGTPVPVGQVVRKHIYISDGLFPLTLGADPEFVIVDPTTGYMQHAANLLMDAYKSKKFGADGLLAELRPDPAASAKKLVKNILELLESRKELDKNNKWIGGASYGVGIKNHAIHAIGGHIHVGQPSTLSDKTKQEKDVIFRRIISILDELVAAPLVRIDGPNQERRRVSSMYGRYGDTREQVGRFEWRVPSGLWLINPELAEAVLGTTQAVSEGCYEVIAEHKYNNDFVSSHEDRENGFLRKMNAEKTNNISKIINESNPMNIDDDFINKCANKLRNLSSYKRHKDEIDAFVEFVKLSEADRKKINYDIKSAWFDKASLTQ